MIALALATVFNSAFAIAIRFAQTRGANLTMVGAVNYATASLFYGILAVAGGLHLPHGETWAIGGVGGVTFSCAFFLLHGLMRQRGVSITAAILGLSVLVPVGLSLIVWGERAAPVQSLGIATAIISLPLLSIRPSTPSAEPAAAQGAGQGARAGAGWRPFVLLAGLFVVNGLSLAAARAFHQTGIQGEDVYFLLFIFTSAALTTCVVWAFQVGRARRPQGRPSQAPGVIGWGALSGIVVGLCNALSNRFIVVSLHTLPGIIVYPFYSAAGLLLTVIASRVIWKERISAMEMAGMALACISIVLINLV